MTNPTSGSVNMWRPLDEMRADVKARGPATSYMARDIASLVPEVDRLQGQWLGMKSEVQVCHTVIGRLEAERDRLRALLTELVDLEGPQPGNIAWARKVWTELGLPDPSAQEDSGND